MDAVNMPNVRMSEADTDASVLVIIMERDYYVNVSWTVSDCE